MSKQYDALIAHLSTVVNLDGVSNVLAWDQQVMMPPGGAEARASQLATLSRIRHEMFTSDETGRLLQDAASALDGSEYDSDAASMIRLTQEMFDQATRIPSDFVAEAAHLYTAAFGEWAKAREADDFAAFAPTLEKIFAFAAQEAEYLGYDDHPYDALLNKFDRGMTTTQVKAIFDTHQPHLTELTQAIAAVSDRVSDTVLHQDFDPDKQREFALWVTEAIGFDYQRGRLDPTVHPFMINFSRDDVRLNTRYNPKFLSTAFFGTLHEAGHGLYEQGSAEALEGTLLAGGTTLSVHESQSRLWENLVGRSKEFWTWALPQLKVTFPDQLGDVSLDSFHKTVNQVQPGFIRVEADEVSYNLHIILRFELETALLTGELKVADLPEAWNTRFEELIGQRPPSNKLGVLQDVHWSAGSVGYFPTYALGNLLAVQYYDVALNTYPDIPEEIQQGKFDTLLGWLRQNIHQHGRKFTSDELTRKATDGPIDPGPYIRYLREKFTPIYDLSW